MVNYRYLGNSGLKVSEITYGNWVTHGSQVDDSAAIATVHAALDAGITTFDTADAYANTAAEAVLGKALVGSAARVARDLHEGLLADRPEGPERHRPEPQAHHGVDQRVAASDSAPTTSTSTRRTATTTRPRSKRPSRPSPTSSARARCSTSASRSGRPSSCARATRSRRSYGIQLISNQPQYSMLWRVIEEQGRAGLARSSASRRSCGRRWRRAC